ncbi:MAG: hypothetical protein Tp172MES00d2C118482111_32 [Prokaryotic dsDNA virus sp.]|nr:MAG: hypothetical protein Tp172MES00d2C118482111_32 [Prokaryotic dsDNA virus sp.]
MSTKDTDQRKRKTYSLHPDRANDLARAQLSISDDLKTNPHRQDILDALVLLLSTDSSVYQKVLKALKS